MIVGICIGSGIFFKSDNVLVATNGNVLLGVVAFVLGAFSIIFGGLAISELAARTDKPGGLVTYAEEFVSSRFASAVGWFQTFVYIPGLCCVVAWAAGYYACQLFGWQFEKQFEFEILLGFIFTLVCFVYNTLSPRFGGFFQNAATAIKLIPLLLVAVGGLIFGDPVSNFTTTAVTAPEAAAGGSSFASIAALLIAAVGPVAFSYDGWVVSTTIAHEVKDSKKNLPRALVVGPLFVLIVYVLYFVGVSSFLGAEKVMELGDDSVAAIFSRWVGPIGAKILLTFVVISVMGTLNGIILGYIRLPYSLALRGDMMPGSKSLIKMNKKINMPLNSAILGFVMCSFWLLLHYVTTKKGILGNSDVTEISIISSYFLYCILYFQVFRLWKKGEIKSVLRGIIVPFFAIIGALFMLAGGVQNPQFVYYLLFCLSFLLFGMIYYEYLKKKEKKLNK